MMWTLFTNQLRRECLLNWRQVRTTVNTCLFFLMLVVFFPLTLPPDASQLCTLAPGLVWIAILLALFLSAERLFQQDYDDGVIEYWLASGQPLTLYISAKTLVHWLMNLLPILIFCPLVSVLFNLNLFATMVLLGALVSGSPALFALCALAAAFATGIRQKGALMALVLLPLTLPIMIFGSAATLAALQGLPVSGYIALLFAFSCVTFVTIPWAIAAIIRTSLVV